MRTFLWTALALLGLGLSDRSAPRAHCPENPSPMVKIRIPRKGMSIQETCIQQFNNCRTDTFYQEKLMKNLLAEYREEFIQNVFIGYVDSVHRRLVFDTLPGSDPPFVETTWGESLFISVHYELKGTLASRKLVYSDTTIRYVQSRPYSVTYLALVDTPFIAFARNMRTPFDVGLNPVDGCYFEPGANFIIGNRILRKGELNDRMPGVSVAMEDFLKALKLPLLPALPVRKKGMRLRFNGSHLMTSPFHQPASQRFRLSLFDIRGRVLGRYDLDGSKRFSAKVPGFPVGGFGMLLEGQNSGPSFQSLIAPSQGASDTIVFPPFSYGK